MIARIKTKDNFVYYTIVFATKISGWKSKLIGFNQGFDRLEVINFWSTHPINNFIKRHVFIVDSDTENWIENEGFRGFKWVINDHNLLTQIENNNEIDSSILSKCKEMQTKILMKEWNEIETRKDIESIYNASLGFHDANIVNINVIEENQIVEVTFSSSWGCSIVIRFVDDVDFRCEEYYGNYDELFAGSIFFEDDFIYWVDCNIDTSKKIGQESCYFRSRNAYWKIEIY